MKGGGMPALIKTDPVRAQGFWRSGGTALRAVAKPAAVARALGVSERYIQMLAAGERPHAIATVAEWVSRLAEARLSPAPIIAYLKMEATAALMSMSEAALRRNLRELVIAETEAEGRLNRLQVDLRPDDPDQLAQLERLALEQAARLEELAATARELRRRIERSNGRRP
jgi:hypothetical protein